MTLHKNTLKIPRSRVYTNQLSGSSVWQKKDFLNVEDFILPVDAEVRDELCSACSTLSSSNRQPQLAQKTSDVLKQVFSELYKGRGFLVIRDWSGSDVHEEKSVENLLRFSHLLGEALPQEATGISYFHVRDEAYGEEKLLAARSRRGGPSTNSALEFHTDSAAMFGGETPDIVALAVLQTSEAGGETMLISSSALHNALLLNHPETLERLYQPFYFDRSTGFSHVEAPLLLSPIFTFFGELRVRYNDHYIYKGHEAAQSPLISMDRRHLDVLARLLSSDELIFRLQLKKNDLLLLNNTTVLHGRTEIVDEPEISKRRHAIRVWIKSRQ
jgi:alpha-ketoglutarate-dependent taurine dioxygenase